jgi:outer membrane protein assembly factor BamB
MRNTAAATFVGLCMLPWAAQAGDPTAGAYQVTPAHNAAVKYAKTWGPKLKVLWTATLDGTASFPMYAKGHVFALVAGSPEEIVTIDATTGQVISKLSAGTNASQGLAYDDGELFSVNSSGVLSAYSVAKRKPLWAEQLPGQYAFSSAPSALNGIVYVGGAGSGGTLYAVNETTGKLLWTQGVANGDDSSPAVTAQGVYVSYPCQYYDFAPNNGRRHLAL